MKASRIVQILTGVVLLGLLGSSGVRAEDTKGKWQFGFGLSYYSTIDYIRSNADLAVSSGMVDENGLPAVQSVDDRPDGNITNQPTIKDNFQLNVSASYGLTRWLALEVAGAYMKAPVGNIEVYTTNSIISFSGDGSQSAAEACGPVGITNGPADPDYAGITNKLLCYNYSTQTPYDEKSNMFIPVGDLTEIPIHLSALVRFRPESPFDPYIGLGIGYVMTNLKESDRFQAVGQDMEKLKIVSASRGEITLQQIRTDANGQPIYPDLVVQSPGYTPKPLQADVRNTFEWHAIGGVDYYVNDRFSVYVDARYSWNTGAVNITADGFHQVRLASPDLGRLLLKQRGSVSNPYLWEDMGGASDAADAFQARCADGPTRNGDPISFTCRGDGYFETEDKNGNGQVDDGEDDGVIYVLPPGSADPNDRLDDLTFTCPSCIGNAMTTGGEPFVGDGKQRIRQLDTEDANNNRMLDRFLLYGIDICSTPGGAGNPLCDTANPGTSTRFVFPEGCGTSIPSPDSTLPPEGCPAPPAPPPDGQLGSITTTGVDNVSDIFLAQGGKIHLGGFSLGFGLKFSF
jgi:opacity protein-like surface antigen